MSCVFSFLGYMKRLPEQIRVKHEKMKEEMMGMLIILIIISILI